MLSAMVSLSSSKSSLVMVMATFLVFASLGPKVTDGRGAEVGALRRRPAARDVHVEGDGSARAVVDRDGHVQRAAALGDRGGVRRGPRGGVAEADLGRGPVGGIRDLDGGVGAGGPAVRRGGAQRHLERLVVLDHGVVRRWSR